METELDTSQKYQLTEPQSFMTAKAYKTKIAEPLVKTLKSLLKTVLARCFEGWDHYHRLNLMNKKLYQENQHLEGSIDRLMEESAWLKEENQEYRLLRKVFGYKQMDELVEKARIVKNRKRDNERSR